MDIEGGSCRKLFIYGIIAATLIQHQHPAPPGKHPGTAPYVI
jgi:hypothetical protein